jgi:hypothetical protein
LVAGDNRQIGQCQKNSPVVLAHRQFVVGHPTTLLFEQVDLCTGRLAQMLIVDADQGKIFTDDHADRVGRPKNRGLAFRL